MNEIMYFVEADGSVLAENMSLDNAAVFAKALFETYFNDRMMKVTIRRMDWNAQDDE